MDVLTGAFQILALVVAVGGVAKVVAPDAFVATLRSLHLPVGPAAARVCGMLEVVIGVGAVLIGGRLPALVVAAAYVVFSFVVIAARRAGAVSCGCFGSAAAPPSTVHVAINATSAAIALAAAVVGPEALGTILADQPLAGVPYLVAVATGVWLTVALDTTGARLIDEVSAVHRLGPVFRDNARTTTVPARTVPRPARTTHHAQH